VSRCSRVEEVEPSEGTTSARVEVAGRRIAESGTRSFESNIFSTVSDAIRECQLESMKRELEREKLLTRVLKSV